MKLIDEFLVSRRRGSEPAAKIQLLHGDLAAIPDEHAVDVLVVSAFPNSYTPSRGTLFEDLYERGLDMRDVASRKQEDQRTHLGCWISQPLPRDQVRQFNFKRVVCFEPRYRRFVANSGFDDENLEQTVGFVFRCLNNFAIPETTAGNDARRFEISSVAMPLLATGNQRVPVEAMLPRLLEAAIFWLEEGLPITELKIVAFSHAEREIAADLFSAVAATRRAVADQPAEAAVVTVAGDWEIELATMLAGQVIETCTRQLRDRLMALAKDNERPTVEALFERLDRERDIRESALSTDATTGPVATPPYDVFVSYAHKQGSEVAMFVQALQQKYPGLRIFYDRRVIRPGGQWIKRISYAVHQARAFIAFLSPDYSASPICWDEFQCAKLKEYNTRASVIKTVRLYSEEDLPPIMGIHTYVDCVEGDLAKLRACAASVLDSA